MIHLGIKVKGKIYSKYDGIQNLAVNIIQHIIVYDYEYTQQRRIKNPVEHMQWRKLHRRCSTQF